ncbi:MAG: cell division protein FtsA [Gammaproteobacteria bacterium]|nr:MAG: cell division protein FtsA [Gammaproteobacteria bacterium]
MVVNIESTVQSIQRAVEEAELMAGCEIHSVYAGIAGSHVRSLNSHGVVAIKDREVTRHDRPRDRCRAAPWPSPRTSDPPRTARRNIVIDGQEGIREPVGMAGVRLEAKVHIVTGAVSAAQNIIKCVHAAGSQVGRHRPRAARLEFAVLTEDEKELGVCLVDIGGGTTDIAVFARAASATPRCIPIAGDQVTNDIAVALRTPTQHAEDIKIKYACALRQLASAEETIEVPGVGDRPPKKLSRMTLIDVVEPRYAELLDLVAAELRRSGYEDLVGAGVVLTGGSAKMEGVVELAEEIFNMPVRLGVPQHVSGLADVVRNPIYATGVGLLLFGQAHRGAGREYLAGGGLAGVWRRMLDWFKGSF